MTSAKIPVKPYQLPRFGNYKMVQAPDTEHASASFYPCGPGLTAEIAHHVINTESEYCWPEVLEMLQAAYEAGKAEGN